MTETSIAPGGDVDQAPFADIAFGFADRLKDEAEWREEFFFAGDEWRILDADELDDFDLPEDGPLILVRDSDKALFEMTIGVTVKPIELSA